MKISKKEYKQEVVYLKTCGLTDDELEAMLEFFDCTVEVELDKRKVRILNSRVKK